MGRSSKDKRDVYYRLAKEEGWRIMTMTTPQITVNLLFNSISDIELNIMSYL
jgi:hypothetical protein